MSDDPLRGAYVMPEINARVYKLMRSLERHKERYLRAWMAHYGAHPSQVHIVMFQKTADVFGGERGEIMRLEYRKDTDQVAALVKAARGITENMDVLRASDRSKTISDDLYAIHKALEPFADDWTPLGVAMPEKKP